MSFGQHVLMTADGLGGVWTYAVELAASLRTHGIRLTLATMGGTLSPEQRSQVAAIDRCELEESSYKLEWMENAWDDVDAAGEWLLALERRCKPDLIHLNGYAHAVLPWQAPTVVVAHSCVLSWWQAVHGTPAPQAWEGYRKRIQAGLSAAGGVVGVSGAMCADLRRFYGPVPSTVAYNGLRTARFHSGLKEEFVLTCGRAWDEAKNIRTLNAAAESLTWPVFLAGSSQHPAGGKVEVDRIRLLGKLAPDQMASWYSRAAIFALPAFYEPFGYAPVEAALSGCALVLGDIPSLREIWGEAAVFVPPRDEKALAQAINDLASREEYRTHMSEKARTRALRYTSEAMVESYLKVYGIGAACAS